MEQFGKIEQCGKSNSVENGTLGENGNIEFGNIENALIPKLNAKGIRNSYINFMLPFSTSS